MKISTKDILKHIEILQAYSYFDIELTANCNLKCFFCPRDQIVRNNWFMTEDLIDILINWLPEKSSIMFSGLGEPLLNDNLLEIVKNISNGNRKIGITTNGQLLTEKFIEQIERSKLDFLQISINELDNKKYKVISGGTSNKVLLKNIDLLYEKGIHNKLELQYSFVKNTISDNKEQAEFSNKYNAKYFQKVIHNRGGYLCLESSKRFNKCFMFSQITFIDCDGNILFCCHDLGSKTILGNIKTNSFDDILNKKINIIRENKWTKNCNICNDVGREAIINPDVL